ncbi:MAG: hypothetical protein ABI461_06490 [Polyangiaceae bacterium]
MRTLGAAAVFLLVPVGFFACVSDPDPLSSGNDSDSGIDASSITTDAAASDSGSLDSGTPDAAPKNCDITKPFSGGALVPGLPAHAGDTRLSPSELTAYYTLNFVDSGYQLDMYTATRATTDEAFGSLTPITALNTTTMSEFQPSIDGTGKTLVFARSVPYGLFIATRGSEAAAFTSASPLAGPLGTATSDLRDPYLTPDSTVLIYADDSSGKNRVYESVLAGGTYPVGNVLNEIATADDGMRGECFQTSPQRRSVPAANLKPACDSDFSSLRKDLSSPR